MSSFVDWYMLNPPIQTVQTINTSYHHGDMYYQARPVDRGGSVGLDEPPRLPNGPLEVFRKLLYWLLSTPQIAVTSAEDCSNTASFLVACTIYAIASTCNHSVD